MEVDEKTHEELVDEVMELRRRVLELEGSEAETRKRLEEQTTLQEALAAISSTLDLPGVLTRIAQQMCLSVNATSAYIARYDEQTNTSTTLAEHLSPEACPEEQVPDFGFTYEEVDGQFLQAMQANQHYIDHVDDPDLAEVDRGYMKQYGARSILYVPLWIREQVIGYAEVWETRRRREFTPEEIALCKAIAQSAAIAVENARLYQMAQAELAERRRAEEALQRAKDELKGAVEERTAELRTTNEELKREIGERQRVEEALRQSEERYRTLFDESRDAINITTRDGQILDANQSFLELFGYSREELADLNALDTYAAPLDRQSFQEEIEKKGAVKDYEVKLRRKNGTQMDCLLTSTVRRAEDGSIVGYQGFLRDITQQKQAREALRESEEKYRNVVERANDGIAIIQDRVIKYANSRLAQLQGNTVEEIIGRPFTDYLHPDELPKLLDRYQRRMAGEQVSPIYDTILTHRDGRKIYAEVNAGIILYEGRPADLVIVRDISERKRAQEDLRESEEHYRRLFDRVPVGLYRTTSDGQIIDANPALVHMLGYAHRDSLLAVEAKDMFVDFEDRSHEQEILEEQGLVRDFEMRLRRRDGTIIWVRDTARAVRDADGRVIYYEGSMEDITERKQAEEMVRRLAYHDALTGLPNRTLFNDRLNMALAHARRKRQGLAVMLLDLDHFKHVNDTLGHSMGDQLLQAVGDRLTALLRESDTVCRMGGDEFLVLLPEAAPAASADEAADRILEAIREPILLDDHELHITTSLGLATYPGDGEDVDTLVRNADIAMYRAKAKGRDNYQQYTDVD